MITLGIESSCDDTSLALVENGVRIRASLLSSQIETHRRFGGVVPEVASRKHLEAINPLIRELLAAAQLTLEEIDQIAVTTGPGLLGALLVGVAAGKAIAWALRKPFIPIHHLEAHLEAAFLAAGRPPEYPFLGLVVSGGHSNMLIARGIRDYVTLGRTADDAPGELFDKIARRIGLGYPGGPAIQKESISGNPDRYQLPRPLIRRGYGFSFSGLKTATIAVIDRAGDSLSLNDLCASLQNAVAETLISKVGAALIEYPMSRLVIAGGVAANSELRAQAARLAEARGVELLIPPPSLCTDNAAMVAAHGFFTANSWTDCNTLTVNALADWSMGDPLPFWIKPS
ncbi:MAG: tRNA (adenosine(37)-N6)-threonylcarbamoyltransferase complex transferase subunit TsaD [Candidatus Riflebacteria bacterium]|nr:tRNA (adenosine(37)-N6)-threonylcarbamoyltransferase complex transferase subunit TsaD [Candidatus Riflebacteria bacterium]